MTYRCPTPAAEKLARTSAAPLEEKLRRRSGAAELSTPPLLRRNLVRRSPPKPPKLGAMVGEGTAELFVAAPPYRSRPGDRGDPPGGGSHLRTHAQVTAPTVKFLCAQFLCLNC